jgi:1-acyl-sn-glycerol-3-phosphate acyltransferase
MRSVVRAWANFHHGLVRLLGTRVAVDGEIPAGTYLIAVKHQSMFENARR